MDGHEEHLIVNRVALHERDRELTGQELVQLEVVRIVLLSAAGITQANTAGGLLGWGSVGVTGERAGARKARQAGRAQARSAFCGCIARAAERTAPGEGGGDGRLRRRGRRDGG